MTRIYQICISVGLILGLATVAGAAMYKWVDKDGNVHYSQQKPSDANYEKLNIRVQRPSPGSTDTSTSDNYSPSDSGSTGNNAVVKKETAKAEEMRRRNCEAAKKNLELYTVFRRIKDKDGTVKRLDDKERAKRIEESKSAIKEFCQ